MNPRKPSRNLLRRPRRGFTLIELLTVVLVISILASTLLFALYGSVQEAKQERAKVQVQRISELVMSRWDSYRTRAVRMSMPAGLNAYPVSAAQARLWALRDLMRLELPDRKTDVLDDPMLYTISYAGGSASGTIQIARPSASRTFLRKANAVGAAWTDEYQDSECLYMILGSIRENGTNGLAFLQEGETGDKDGDGMSEVWDPWGNPIAFLRWPCGMAEHPGADMTSGTGDDIPTYSNLQLIMFDASTGNLSDDVYDPFDPLRVDRRASVAMPNLPSPPPSPAPQYHFNFALYPLVASAGADGDLDFVRFDFDPANPTTLVTFHYFRNTSNPNGPANDPWSILPTCGRRLGEPFVGTAGYADNITNHLVEIR